MFRKYPEFFQDPKIDYPINHPNLNFSDYISLNKQIIAKYHFDLNHSIDLIIEANSPYELQPKTPIFSEKHPDKIKYGALLIHGLLDTPFIMKDVAKSLQSQGLLVRSLLLPGHGTVPGALLNVSYKDWLRTVQYGVTSLSKEVENIILVGFSTGAALSLYHTLQNPSQIVGIIMASPAFKIYSKFAFVNNWHRTISWSNSRAKWLFIGREFDYTKYRSIPFNAVSQVYKLTKAIKKIDHKKQPTCPLFMTLSFDDLIVSSKASINYFLGLKNPNNKMILYKTDPHNFNDSRIIIQNSSYPELRIINFSHISLLVAPNNPHYGKFGDYPFASRVDDEHLNVSYSALDKPRALLYERLHKLKLIPNRRERLTFNPNFDFMMGEMVDWIFKLHQ